VYKLAVLAAFQATDLYLTRKPISRAQSTHDRPQRLFNVACRSYGYSMLTVWWVVMLHPEPCWGSSLDLLYLVEMGLDARCGSWAFGACTFVTYSGALLANALW